MFHFLSIDKDIVKNFNHDFYEENKQYYEINKEFNPIGFYGLRILNESSVEMSVFINEDSRNKITKSLAIKCLTFPFSLGFDKMFISTELKKMSRFLKKMGKLGVKYLFDHDGLEWFEVQNNMRVK